MDLIPRARLTTAFLESNASTHESVFGAIAEIIDNAYDSGASKLEIDVASPDNNEHLQGKMYLSFRDTGCGMKAKEMFNVIAYGWSDKNDNPNMIGMYGNGLKSGSMRVGNDCLVLSMRDDELSALLISQTFIKTSHAGYENLDNEVICPLPSWRCVIDEVTGQRKNEPIYDPSKDLEKEKMRHETEVELILQYSPFATEESLLDQFYGFETSGTVVFLFQLNLNERGETELSIDKADDDIHDIGDQGNVSNSLRTFLSNLYLKPKMQIYLRQDAIRPVRLYDLMYDRRKYELPKNKFRSIAKTKIIDLKEKKKKIDNKIRKTRSEIASIMKIGDHVKIEGSALGTQKKIRKLNMIIEKYEADLRRFDTEIKMKEKVSNVSSFSLILGYHIQDRATSGLRIFNKNRLIVEIDGKQLAQWPLGVLACVDVPAALMQPSMSKQRFSDEREFKTLIKLCVERAHDYQKRVRFEFVKWCSFGYPTSDPSMSRESTPETNKAVHLALPRYFRCSEDNCGKYRRIMSHTEEINPAFFICMENKDTKFNSCQKDEEKLETKTMELMPTIKVEHRDVEEVAVSPEKPKVKRAQKGNAKKAMHDPPVRNDNYSDSDDDELIIKRNLRRRRPGHISGAEVTSGFDRHRVVEVSDDSDSDSGRPKSKNRRRAPSDDSTDVFRLENQLAKMKKESAKEKTTWKERLERLEKDNRDIVKDFQECIKHFYPTSWKSKTGKDHSAIEKWSLEKVRATKAEWQEDYTKDLKKVLERNKARKAATAKLDLMKSVNTLVEKNLDINELKKQLRELQEKVEREVQEAKNKTAT